MVPTLVENPQFLVYLFVNIFENNYYDLEARPYYYWRIHAYCIKTMALCTLVISIIIWKEDASLPAMFNPIYSQQL